MKTKINLGCGSKKVEGFLNCDIDEKVEPALIVDLNNPPYPFAENSIDEIRMDNVIEHLHIRLPVLLDELKRILKRNGKVQLIFPNFFRWKARINYLAGKLEDSDGWEVNHSLLISPSEFQNLAKQYGFAATPKANWVRDLLWAENNIVLRKREDC